MNVYARDFARRLINRELSTPEYLSIIAIGLTTSIFAIAQRYVFVFLLMLAFSAVAVYFVSYLHSAVDFAPVFPFAFIITQVYGIQYAVLFVLAVNIIPVFIGGGIVDITTISFFGLMFGILILSTFLPFSNILLLGILVSAIYQTLNFFLMWVFTDIGIATLSGVSGFLVNVAYYLSLGRILLFVLN